MTCKLLQVEIYATGFVEKITDQVGDECLF